MSREQHLPNTSSKSGQDSSLRSKKASKALARSAASRFLCIFGSAVFLLASLSSAPSTAHASDALGSAALGGMAARQADAWHFGLAAGSRGISYSQGSKGSWVFTAASNYSLDGGSFSGFGHYEGGMAWRLVDLPWFTTWAGASILLSAHAGFSGGLRGLAGAAFHIGDTWFFRPGVNLSVGGAFSPWYDAALLTPVDVFVEAGWNWLGFQPFIRASAGVDPWSGALPTPRAELMLGFAFTWREVEIKEKLQKADPSMQAWNADRGSWDGS